MMRTSLVALAAARFFQAPSPASVPVSAPAASYMPVSYGYEQAPVSYGFEQASAFPSAPVAVAMPTAPAPSSSSKALPLMAGAALGVTVAVLFGGGKKAATKAKPAAKALAKKPAAKTAAKKPVAKKPVAKKPAPKPAPKPVARPAPKRAAPAPVRRSGKSPVGKGGIFPWITNEPGTYSKPLMLSSIDFTGDAADSLIGWGAMPDSVKNMYNPTGRKGLFGGCITPAKR